MKTGWDVEHLRLLVIRDRTVSLLKICQSLTLRLLKTVLLWYFQNTVSAIYQMIFYLHKLHFSSLQTLCFSSYQVPVTCKRAYETNEKTEKCHKLWLKESKLKHYKKVIKTKVLWNASGMYRLVSI